jgi:ubiquinol-cytochrome c reductase cytochrome b subunit
MNALFAKLTDWLDNRTGIRAIAHDGMYENIPGGSRWIYITGSMLVFAFVTQAITGIFLWMNYSPSSQNAWASVYFITYELQGGFLLRGVHHYMAQFMVVLLPLHLLQVVLCRAYVAPREINYWLGLVLMLLVLGLGLTGYLLPWDQKGYWATKVATELMALPPGGEHMQKLAVGSSQYGHLTLTRFFAMHAGVLPALLVIVLGLHIAMFRRHGITAKSSPKRADEYFWPKQVFKDSIGCLLLLVAVVSLAFWKEAELGPPAEPTESYGAARPEWYFLFLFQLLKKFKYEFVGAIVVPGLVMAFLFALPLIAKIRFGHLVNVVVILVIVMGAGYLTYEAIDHDNYDRRYGNSAPADPESKEYKRWKELVDAAKKFHEAQDQAHVESERLHDLIEFYGIPRAGALVGLVQRDPEIQGPRIFRQKCASCHSYLDQAGEGIDGPKPPQDWDGETSYGGANLFGIGTPEWFLRFLDPDRIGSDQVFGQTKHKDGTMLDFVQTELAELDDEGKETIAQIAAALSAEANLIWRHEEIARDRETGRLDKGVEALQAAIADQACTDCHKFHELGDEIGPDLTGYGSFEWLYGFISDPTQNRFYGEEGNDRMQKYAEHADDPALNLLSPHEIDMLVRWLRGDDRDLALKLEMAKRAAASVAAADSAPETEDTETASGEADSTTTEPDANEAATNAADAKAGN